MKDIIRVELKTQKIQISSCKTDLLAIGVFSDAKKPDKTIKELDEKLGGDIEKIMKIGDFKAKENTSFVIYANGRISAKRVLLVGLGEKKKAGLDTLRKAAARTAKMAVTIKAKDAALAVHKAFGGRFDLSKMAQVSAEGVYFGSYLYDEYVTGNENSRADSVNVRLIDTDAERVRKLNKGLTCGEIIGNAQSYARTLTNRPGNIINPATLANEAKRLAGNTKGLTCTVFDKKQLASMGMGGILAVGSGSQTPPTLTVLNYTAGQKSAKKLLTVALVGKAVTFDSGGISIKPSRGMQEMKLDKSGGTAVLAVMKAVAQLKLQVNVCGIIPAAENMLSAGSYRPGDIVTTFSGKTVEIQNTDAEGRMILCDGISYADKENCDIIIDIATLTGACKVALGKYMAGVMSNDDRLSKQLLAASKQSGEKLWLMPSGKEYSDEMKSRIADLKNVGSRWGGACTAAAFLSRFAGNKKWAHVDIAGVDTVEKATESAAEGSRGFGVRLLTTYLMNMSGKTS